MTTVNAVNFVNTRQLSSKMSGDNNGQAIPIPMIPISHSGPGFWEIIKLVAETTLAVKDAYETITGEDVKPGDVVKGVLSWGMGGAAHLLPF